MIRSRFLLALLIVSFVVTGCGGAAYTPRGSESGGEQSTANSQTDNSSTTTSSTSDAKPPIYVSIVTHSEEQSKFPNLQSYELEMDSVVDFANMLAEEGVKYNLQSDWTFAEATSKWGAVDTSKTNGKNVFQWLIQDKGFEVDPHAHETQYNYADVFYLLTQLGVTQKYKIAGGYVAAPEQKCVFEHLTKTITGEIYPDATVKFDYLWGASTPSHVDTYWEISGIWYPESCQNFWENSTTGSVATIGSYDSSWEGLDDLLKRRAAGELDPNKIYTVAIFEGQANLKKDGVIEDFRQELETHKTEYGDALKWVSLGELVDVWKTQYNSEANVLVYGSK